MVLAVFRIKVRMYMAVVHNWQHYTELY